jgi:hypothetical protein
MGSWGQDSTQRGPRGLFPEVPVWVQKNGVRKLSFDDERPSEHRSDLHGGSSGVKYVCDEACPQLVWRSSAVLYSTVAILVRLYFYNYTSTAILVQDKHDTTRLNCLQSTLQ